MISEPEHTEAGPIQPYSQADVPDAQEIGHSLQATALHAPVDDTTNIAGHRLSSNESIVLQEQTMVAGVEDNVEKQEASQPIKRQPRIVDGEFAEEGIVHSDPLRNPRPTHFSTDPKEEQDVTIVEEELDVVNSNGHALYPDMDTKPSHVASKRASHLRLDFKPPSPQPWEIVDSPNEESREDPRGFYSVGAQKFSGIQSARLARPLIPKSSYYFGPPPSDSAFGTPPTGQIGVHHPREIIRIERDYTGGELTQFAPIYPLELEGRINPTQFLESINAINELLISAHSLHHSFMDNMLAVFSLQLSKLFLTSHYDKEMARLRYLFEDLNAGLYNPVGLNIIWPRDVAFLFLEIEYY